MAPLEAPYPGVTIDTFIFFLRSLCKIIWMNVHYFPNAPRKLSKSIKTNPDPNQDLSCIKNEGH